MIVFASRFREYLAQFKKCSSKQKTRFGFFFLKNKGLRLVVRAAISRAPPVYNCKAAYLACRKKRLLSTHQWHSALVVVGVIIGLK